MAVKFRKSNQGITNIWTQLKDIVSTKPLYNAADYENLTTGQKEAYLTMLYQNGDALAQRLPQDYYSEYANTENRFALLYATNAKYQFDANWQNPQYRQKINEEIDAQLDSQLSSDINKDATWVDWVVKNKYDGSYAKFVADYSGESAKTYEDILTEMVPTEYDLDEVSFKTDISNLQAERESLLQSAKNKQSEAYDDTLKYVREQIAVAAKKQAYDDASAIEKIGNTIRLTAALWSAELVETVEGVGDALVAAAGAIGGIFGADTDWAVEAVRYDWWAPETWLDVAQSKSYLSMFADNNIAKWIHEIGISIIDMAPLAIPGIGQAAYYISAFGKNVETELSQDYSFGRAFVYAAGSTAIEYATEKISGSKFFGGGIFEKWEKFGDLHWATKIAHDALGEGLEEVISGIGSDLWHGVVTGDLTLDTKAGWSQLGKSFLIGGLVGGIMAGGDIAITQSIINKTAINVKAANGSSITLSGSKAVIIEEYVRRTGKKIEEGKRISDRELSRFNILKDVQFTNIKSGKRRIRHADATIKTGYYETDIEPLIKLEVAAEAIIKETKKGAKKKSTDKQPTFEEEIAALVAETDALDNTDSSVVQFTETKKDLASLLYNQMDEESKTRLREDFRITGVITLGKLNRLFGEDAVTDGIKLYAQYADKTINEIVELLQVGSDESAFIKTETDSILKNHFADSDFVILTPKPGSTVSDKYEKLNSIAKAFRGALKNFESDNKIKLFLTTGSTVSTSFFVDNTLYINGSWLAERDIDSIKDIVISKYCAEDARRSLDKSDKFQSARTLLLETIQKLDNPNRSIDIMLQEMAYIMFYTKNNILMQQMMAYAPDENGANMLTAYFDTLRRTYANISVQRAAGMALNNMQAVCEELFETGSEPDMAKTLPADTSASMEDVINEYRNHNFRAFPFITGKTGIPRTMAKTNAMYLHFKNTYGFNKKLDLTRKINWIKQLLNPKNYDGDGFKRLTSELEKYQGVDSKTGYIYDTIPSKKTTSELLNYYLDMTCGLMVFSNGVMTETEFTTQVLDFDAIENMIKNMNTTAVDRRPIGKVSDFLSDDARNKLAPYMQDIPVYAAFDSGSDTHATIVGDTNSGMSILLNISNADTTPSVMVGGKQLILNADGELVKNADGSFAIQDNTKLVSKLAYVLGHEIGHSIGMMLKFNGTFTDTDIANTYTGVLSRATTEDRQKFVDDIKSWLMLDGKIRKEMLSFAHSINQDIDPRTSSQKAEATILDFISKLNSITTSKFNTKKEREYFKKNVFGPIGHYLYFTGFANEMFANGRAASVARTDIIHSTLYSESEPVGDFPALPGGTKFITNSDLYFIQLLNGKSIWSPAAEDVLEYIESAQESSENITRRVFASIQNVDDLAKELHVTFAKELVDPDFWASKRPTYARNERATRSSLIESIEQQYNCTYDGVNQTFEPGHISKALRGFQDLIPRQNEAYSVVTFNDGRTVNTTNTAAYSTNSEVNTFIVYKPKAGNKPAKLTVRLSSYNITNENKRLMNTLYSWANGNITVIAGGKTFNNMRAALKYLNAEPGVSKNNDFETLFERVIESADLGRQIQYENDTIYMTTDGKIYNIDIAMSDWNGYAQMLQLPENVLGQYTKDSSGNFVTNNPEGISYNLSRLFDEKGVLRLYRAGNTWAAYGVPNKLQDDFINELKADRQSLTPYETDAEFDAHLDRKLFVASKRKSLGVQVHGNDWSNPDFIEVKWRNRIWYKTIRRIMTKYDITKLQDFELLGFSQEFIDRLKSTRGMPEKYPLAYIRDGSQTDLSRNILIENCPDFSRGMRGVGDWKKNAHIHTIEEAREYWDLAVTYGEIISDNKVYDNVLDLKRALEKRRSDPAMLAAGERLLENSEQYLKTLGNDIYLQILNKDSSTGLQLSRAGFQNIIGYIGQYYDNYMRRKKHGSEVGLEAESDDKSYLLGESTETPKEFMALEKNEPRDETFKGFLAEIMEAKKISDTEARNAALQELLESLDYERYEEYEYKAIIKNRIINELEGSNLELQRTAELNRLKTRVEKYHKLEMDSPEQLRERRKLIRLYERTRNTRLDKISAGSKDYYESYLKLLRDVGSYTARMNEKFSNFYAKAGKIRERVENKELFDVQIDKLRELRNAILQVDMEYPGWYKNYESLLQLAQDWLNGKKETQGRAFSAVRTDIINFVNQFESDTAFKQKMAEREKVSDYIFAKQVRGIRLAKPDLERFKNIPNDIKPISDFSKDAQEMYNQLKMDATVLANVLQDTDSMTELLKLYGQDFIYNIQRLYNELTAPVPGTGISEAKKDVLSRILSKAGAQETAIVAVADATKQARRTVATDNEARYYKFATDRALRTHDYLAAGKPISDAEYVATLKSVGDNIKNYTRITRDLRRTMRIYFSNMTQERKSTIVKQLKAIAKRYMFTKVVVSEDGSFAEIATKFSPFAVDPNYSDVGSIDTRSIEEQMKDPRKPSKYQNDYYRLRAEFKEILSKDELENTSYDEREFLKEKPLIALSDANKFKIATAILEAYYNLVNDPQTDRSIQRFVGDVQLALDKGQINRTISGSVKSGKTRERVSIQVPEKYASPFSHQFDITAALKPIFEARPKPADWVESEEYRTIMRFRQTVDTVSETPVTSEDELSKAEQLRRKRVARDKKRAREANITIVAEGDKYDVTFDTESGSFKDDSGNTMSEDLVDFRQLSDDVFNDYLVYNISKGLDEGWLKTSRHGNIIDPETEKVVAYGTKNEKFSDGSTPSEEDFEFDDDWTPSEEDFEFDDEETGAGASKFIEDDMTFEPISLTNEDFAAMDTEMSEKAGEYSAKEHKPKGEWTEVIPEKRYYQVKSGLSQNTARMLDYQPNNWKDTNAFDTKEFIDDNAAFINKFNTNARDMLAFVERIESNPSVPLNSPQEAIIFALLNQVSNNAIVDNDLKRRAETLINKLSSRAGRILGMTKSIGVTPVDQLVGLCSKLLNLNDTEKQTLSNASQAQINAIKKGDYAAANRIYEGVLNILKKHKDELPVSMNVFAKGLSPEERTARWHNITERISSWKYFAMLGSPTTFFTKNITSNVIITGMDAAAEFIGSKLYRGKSLSADYTFDEGPFETALKNKSSLTVQEVQNIIANTIANKNDIAQVDAEVLTKELNAFIATRTKTDGKAPTAARVTSHANEWMRKRYYQYKMGDAITEDAKSAVEENLVNNGLLDGIMNDQVAKYDRGYDIKIGKLREVVLNEETSLDNLSEEDAAILSNAIKRDAPFGNNPNNILNKYYRFIFKTMELGDKKFIRPKIIKTVEKLVSSNMTNVEIQALKNGDKAARAKFNDFVQYATDDAMKTYFRADSEFQKKIMRLFKNHPVAQMIFSTIIPFPRMAMNTMSTALSYSPIGFIKALHIAATSQDSFTRLKISKELGKATTGTVLLAIGAALAAAGILDFDDEDEYAGVQLVIANKIKIALNDFMPSATPFIIGATMTNGWTESFWTGIYDGGNALLDATLLGEAIEIFGGNKQPADVVTDTFSSFINQFMPSIFRHMARTIDPTQKKYSSNKGAKIIQRIAAALPGTSLLVPAKIDPYTGNAVYQNAKSDQAWAHVLSFVNAFSPAKINLNTVSDIEEESKAVGAPTTGPAKTYKIDGVEYTISDEVYRDYQILRAKLYSQYAQSIINTTSYQNMSLEKKRLKLRSLQTKATNEARKQLNIGK